MLENNLSASELLTAFIDGELDASDTQMLFYQLANDAELQSEMQDLIAIRTTFANSSVQPPPDLRNAILKSTVYKNGFAGKFAVIPALFSNYFAKVAASVASLVLIGIFSFWLVDYFKDSEAVSLSNNNQINDTFVSDSDSDSNILNNTTEQSEQSGTTFDLSQKSSDDQLSNTILGNNNKTYNSNNTDNLQNTDNYTIENNLSDSEYKGIDFSDNLVDSANPPHKSIERKDYINFYDLRTGINDFLENVSLTMNKQSVFSNPNPKIVSADNPVLNDFSFNLNYHFDNNHSLGVTFGREYFPMQFSGTEMLNNREIEYEYPLSYNALWAGVSYSYTFDRINRFFNLQPYSKVTVGGTSLGPVAKISLGTNYFFNDKIGVYAGLKYGALFYSYQNNVFVTNKYGLDYGLIIRL